MIAYFVKKIFYGISVLFGVTFLVFFLFKMMPDPARLVMGQRADVSSIEAIRKAEYLDKPVLAQFVYYMNDVSPISIYTHTSDKQKEYAYTPLFSFQNNCKVVVKLPYLRRSYQTKKKVSEILITALPTTVLLGLSAMLFATLVGVLLGVVAALNQHSLTDNSILVGSVLGISQPSYFSGVVLALVFGYWLADYTGLSPTGQLFGLTDLGDEVFQPKNLILPALALGIRPVAVIMQLTRSSMLEVMGQDYIRTAKSKGLSNTVVTYKHGLRNALNPVVTTISGWLASVLAGSFFIEKIFDIKGMGFVTITALENLDFPVVMGAVLFTAFIFVSINIFIDVLYGLLDPRITHN